MGILTTLTLFIGFGLFLYSLDVYGYLYLPLPILGFLGLVLAVFYYWKLRLDNRDGVLNEAGADLLSLDQFENMLREIARLDQAELESIVVWNRLLVYADLIWLCGQGQPFDEGSSDSSGKSRYQPLCSLWLAQYVYHSSAQMSHYASVANTASTYSYLLEVEVLAVVSLEAEVVEVSVPLKENCHRLKNML